MVLITAQLGVARPDWGQRKVRNITAGTRLHLGKFGWRRVLPMVYLSYLDWKHFQSNFLMGQRCGKSHWSCGEVGTRSVSTVSPRPLWFHATEFCVFRFKSVPTWWLCGPIGACAARLSPARIFVLLSSSLLMPSGEIYLRLKPYLVVEIASDVLTEHCCQVCVLAMMFCRSDCRLCVGMCGKWLRNHGKLLV